MNVVFRILDKIGDAFIEPRREDGHGSANDNRSYVQDQHQQSLTEDQLTAAALAKESTLGSVKSNTDNLDIATSALRDGLRGGASKTLSDIWTSLQTQREISATLWTDDSGAHYVRRDVIDESAGSVTVEFTDESGALATPGSGLRPLASTDKETVESLFTATATGTGYAEGDILARVLVVDTSVSPPAISATWMNVTQGTIISAPTGGTYQQNAGLTDDELRADPIDVDVQKTALIKRTITASSSGDTTVHAPASGKKIRLYFFGYSAGSSVSGCLVQLKLEGYNEGNVFDAQYLSAAGQPYARNIKAGDGYIEGEADGVLEVALSADQNVYVNYEIEEIDP